MAEIQNTTENFMSYGNANEIFQTTKAYILSHSGGGSTSGLYYATSSTASSTASKIAATSSGSFSLKAGATVSVLFSTSNTVNAPKLNVDDTGDIAIYVGGSVTSSTNNLKWNSNSLITFIYDGSYWRVLSIDPARDGGAWYGTCSTSATSASKTVSCSNFRKQTGSIISVKFTCANSKVDSAITLNVNSTGASTIYLNNQATSSSNPIIWNVNDIITFIYDGSHWIVIGLTSGEGTSEDPDGTYTINRSSDGNINSIVFAYSGGTRTTTFAKTSSSDIITILTVKTGASTGKLKTITNTGNQVTVVTTTVPVS